MVHANNNTHRFLAQPIFEIFNFAIYIIILQRRRKVPKSVCMCVCVGGGGGGTQTRNLCTFGKEPI